MQRGSTANASRHARPTIRCSDSRHRSREAEARRYFLKTMNYAALRFIVDADDADAWSDALLAEGAFSVDAADPHAGSAAETPIYAEPGERDAVWPVTQLTVLFDSSNDPGAALQRAAMTLARSAPPHQTFTVPEQDWVQSTQKQFDPIRISSRLWIVPSWHEPPAPQAINIRLDPGVAFGTGTHFDAGDVNVTCTV